MEDLMYKKGDWIVHTSYGVGQIRKIEKKPIHGKVVKVFRVKTSNSIYWLPVKNADNDRIRRIAGKKKLKKALKKLGTKPEKMGKNYRSRNSHIAEVFTKDSVNKKVELLRDLLGLRKKKVWSNTENDAAIKIFNQLANEYSIVHEIPVQEAQKKINALIMKYFDDYSMI